MVVAGLVAGADGQGVDEQADHGLGAGQRCRAAGDGGAEDDVGLAAVAGQQEGPGAADDGVERQAAPAREVGQAVLVGWWSLPAVGWRSRWRGGRPVDG